MRTLYFDCFAGISGDMTLGALVAAGADAREFKERLALLNLEGYEIEFETVDRSGISATRAVVTVTKARLGRVSVVIIASEAANQLLSSSESAAT